MDTMEAVIIEVSKRVYLREEINVGLICNEIGM